MTTSPPPQTPSPQTPPPAPAVADQRPHGHRLRRTTLPRSTRGWSRGIVWSLIGLTSFATIYGLIARIETSVNATGKLRPIGGVTSITVPFNAPVESVLVKEGQSVEPGQPLIALREKAVRDQRKSLESQRALWSSQLSVLANRLGLSVTPPSTAAGRRQLSIEKREVDLRERAAIEERRRSQINLEQQASDLVALKRQQAIEANITARMTTLLNEGAISRLELDRQQQRAAELEGAISRTEKELESARYRVRESQFKQQQIPAAELKLLYSQYDNARLQLMTVDANLAELDDRLKLGRLVAPVAGRVFDLNVKKGEILSPARPALQIVPSTRLEVALSVSNRDIGFLLPGMPVDVRVTSFPFTDYGSLKGTISRIGADALPPDPQNVQESFPVVVTIDASELSRNGRSYQLRSGMAVSALIQLGSRPVISLISDRLGGFMESTRSIR
ncbi:MAG: HlyD family efflux transporter periplasmic adaptor subunit [Cyanobium sp. M30B3]|nr:MAG: HlyD family efflux transporter periplasmic adaptor subunit [Cyanobium sp. M30B3]